MNHKRSMGVFAALFAVLLACFFMPDYVAGIIDRNTLDKPTTQAAKSISFEAGPDLPMPLRLQLTAGTDQESIALKNGKLSEDELRTLVLSELRRFFGSTDMIEDLWELTVDECVPMFVIDTEDPSINMVIWQVLLSSAGGQRVTVEIDEETGAILHVILYRNVELGEAIEKPGSGEHDPLRDDAERLTGLISAYYGVPAVLKYELSGGLGYYTVELDFDGMPVALYGIVREGRVTINE